MAPSPLISPPGGFITHYGHKHSAKWPMNDRGGTNRRRYCTGQLGGLSVCGARGVALKVSGV